MTTTKKKLTPSQRLKAAAGRTKTGKATGLPRSAVEAQPSTVSFAGVGELAATTKVRSKWLVHEKREVPEIVDGVMRTRWLVHLKAVYEPLSVLHGQATVQGCADNRMFGAGVPEADLVMKLDSKAIADAYQVGRAFVQEHVEVRPDIRPLW